jgi:ABC-type antimicrobial peptide transport system permease subunit
MATEAEPQPNDRERRKEKGKETTEAESQSNTSQSNEIIQNSKLNPEFNSGQNSKFVFRPWQELIEGTMAGASENKKQIVVYLYFLYGIVGFGLLSMVIMLANERRKEFGVMAALGTKKRTIIISLLFEMLFVALLGIMAGIVVSLPIVAQFHYSPIILTGEMADALAYYGLDPVMPFEFTFKLFVTQPLIVFSMAIVVSVYPVAMIRRLKVIEAIRG